MPAVDEEPMASTLTLACPEPCGSRQAPGRGAYGEHLDLALGANRTAQGTQGSEEEVTGDPLGTAIGRQSWWGGRQLQRNWRKGQLLRHGATRRQRQGANQTPPSRPQNHQKPARPCTSCLQS